MNTTIRCGDCSRFSVNRWFSIAICAISFASAQNKDEPAWQTAAGHQMSFEVASIRPDSGPSRPSNFPMDTGDAYASTGGRLSADSSLAVYIRFAYKLTLTPDEMVAHLPKWVTSERFRIEAKAPIENPTKDQMRLMMQSLLADRFKLALHFDTQEKPVWALTVARPGKLGTSLKPHSEGPPCGEAVPDAFPPKCDVIAARGGSTGNKAAARNITMEILAGALQTFENLGRPVVDRTGLTDRYDFTLEWSSDFSGATPDIQHDTSRPGLQQAMRDQLGLKLESAKAPVRTLIIDHIERPTEN